MLTDRELEALDIRNPFLLRSIAPPPEAFRGRRMVGARRIGKRIALAFEGDHWAVIHLMIAGRLRWRPAGKPLRTKAVQATFTFPQGTLHVTEAGSQRRASLHLVGERTALTAFDRGGLEPLEVPLGAFAERLRSENHTLKRALTDPRMLSGIGNAFSDEILHRARLSPLQLTSRLDDAGMASLHAAMRAVLEEWIARTRREVGDGFPEIVTAFRDGMAVHGRYREPCPDCGHPVQRIRYASNETNYCASCQTGGRLLADRALSRLLREDWPRSLEELEGR